MKRTRVLSLASGLMITAMTVVVTCLVVEGIARTTLWWKTGSVLLAQTPIAQDSLNPTGQTLPGVLLNLNHGYGHRTGLQFTQSVPRDVYAKFVDPNLNHWWFSLVANNFGFWSKVDYPVEKHDDDVIVGVFGGSMAMFLTVIGHDAFKEQLERELGGHKNVVILSFAFAGMKQPDTASIFNYFRSIGQAFDVVINFDGGSDVLYGERHRALGWPLTAPSVDFVRPLTVATSANLAVSETELQDQLDVLRMRRYMRDLHAWNQTTRSASVYFLTDALEKICSTFYQKSYARLVGGSDVTGSIVQIPPKIKDEEKFPYKISSLIWARATLATQAVVEKIDHAIFIEALPPNRHLTKYAAMNDNGVYSTAIKAGYPELIKQGEILKSKGVDVLDLTHIFDGEKQPVFGDECCHYTQTGNDKIAVELAKHIASRMRR